MDIPKTFNPIRKSEQAFLLASHHPNGINGKMFDLNDNMGKLIMGLSSEHVRFQEAVLKVVFENQISTTDEFIQEWERSLGIPNPCFSINNSLSIRRLQVQAVFSKFGGAQTEDDFIRIGQLFGINIEFVDNGLPAGKQRSHTWKIIINGSSSTGTLFPLPFPLPFSSGDKGFIQCLFNNLAPANVAIVVN